MFQKFGWSVTNGKSWNKEEHWRAGIEREFSSRADQRILSWFGYVERMDEYRMARMALMAEVERGTDGDRG